MRVCLPLSSGDQVRGIYQIQRPLSPSLPLRVLIAMTSFRVALDVAAVVAVAAAAVGFLLGALTEVRPMYLVDSIDRRIACGGNTANLSKV